MDTLIAICGKSFVVVCADSSQARSIQVIKSGGEDKIMQVDSSKLLAASGENGDRVAFTQYIQKNVHLYELRTGITLSVREAAHYVRTELASALRSRNAYQTNLLMAGVDPVEGPDDDAEDSSEEGDDERRKVAEGRPQLYFIDYLASMQPLSFACHGYAGHFLYGLLDQRWRPGMSEPEVMALLDACLGELKTRFLISQKSFFVKVVDAQGVRVVREG